MKLRTLILTLLLSWTLAQHCLSQSFYESGNVTLKNGTTIEGLIDFQKWKNSPENIKFLKDDDSDPIIYTASELQSFEVSKMTYPSSKIQIIDHKKKESVIKELFLIPIYNGKINLYKASLVNEYPHFYYEENGQFKLLNPNQYFENLKIKSNGKSFKEQLKEITSDCKKIDKPLNDPAYTKSYLLLLMNEYELCGKTQITDYSMPTNKLGVSIGAVATDLSFPSESSTFYLVQTEFERSITPFASVFYDMPLTRQRHYLSVYLDALYTYFNTNGSYRSDLFMGGDSYSINASEFKMGYLKVSPKLRFNLRPAPKKNIYGAFGIAFGANLMHSSINERTNYSFGTETKTSQTIFEEIDLIESSVLMCFGYQQNKIGLEYRYEISNGFVNANVYKSRIIRHYLHLLYSF